MLDSGFTEGNAAGRPVTLGGAARELARLFSEAGLASPQLDARILAAEACGLVPEDAILRRDRVLSREETRRIAGSAARRLKGEPVSRILGRREFWGLSFRISPDTLDPRPETELLVETVLDHATARGLLNSPLRILDLGTGCGCILAALLTALPASRGIGIDLSEAALAIAQDNLRRLGLLDRASFLCGDWMSAIGSAGFDVIAGNPPYIARSEILDLEAGVRNYDPRAALDGGEDGLDPYRTLLPQAFAALRAGGLAVFEIGYRQGQAVLELMKQSAGKQGFGSVRMLTDLAGADRAVAGVRQS